MKTFLEWQNLQEETGPGKGNTTDHWRYKCPHCNGDNAYSGILGEEIRFRGGAKCVDCGEGFSAVGPSGKKLLLYAGKGDKCEKCGKESNCSGCPWCG